MQPKRVGWDVGGAHLKCVVLDDGGQLLYVKQIACPLWQGLHHLDQGVKQVVELLSLAREDVLHAVTMTGELVDLFQSRAEGVLAIAERMLMLLGHHLHFYCIPATQQDNLFIPMQQVPDKVDAIASANWHASAQWLAHRMEAAVLVDIGSTTTDITIVKDGNVYAAGCSDATRMQQDSLIYTGVVRTPVMALAQQLTIDGQRTNIAAEHFATMADVYRLTGELPDTADIGQTADGADKSTISSARRLARMVGYDFADKAMEIWLGFAGTCRQAQLAQLVAAIRPQLISGMKVVGAGVGTFLAEAVAKQVDHPFVPLSSVLQASVKGTYQHDVAVCLPAYAVAMLAMTEEVE